MNKTSSAIRVFMTIGLITTFGVNDAFAGGSAHAHIGHVATSFNDTPSNKGLLPTAFKESIVAGAHANYAKNASDDLDSMQSHAGHVRHAIDPSLESSGPGMGYGLLKAAQGAIDHITLASESSDASEPVKTHTVHVVSSINNAIERTRQALIEADAIIAATTAEGAAPHALKMAELTEATFAGLDANGDGKITWHEGEGGLKVAEKHMKLMMDAEGL